MKKLRIKVFITLFTILSIFSISVLVFNNVREYSRQKDEIRRVIERNERRPISNSNNMLDLKRDANLQHNIFVDYDVYLFSLNSDGSINSLLKYSYESSDISKDVVTYANKVKSSSDDEDINIFTNKYSYKKDNNLLIVVDNSYQSNRVIKYLISSICVFIIIEVIVFILSRYLTKWIVKPVEDSFDREKRFIGDASHELKTPIAVIMASADAYEQDKDKKWLLNIKSESDRMNKLVTDLLDLNSLENNQKELKKEELNLSKVVESSLLSYESLFYEKKLKFDYDIKDNIIYEFNENKIKELISILVDNAIKYSKEHGHVNVELYKDKDIYLKVSNKGEEIPLEERDKIFDRFYKVDKSRNRKSNSYGLGLSIAKKIVELHNGEISVDCNKGKTTFIVKL